jgi:hypothetical protein
MMKFYQFGLLGLFLFVIVVFPMAVTAQDDGKVFALPDAHAGEAYRVEIEQVLREKYRLKLDAGSQDAIIQWSLAGGELPLGMIVRTDGTIGGSPADPRPESYRFRLKAVDVTAKDEELYLDFAVAVRAGRLRLSKIQGPRLVLVDMRTSQFDESSSDRRSTAISETTARVPSSPKDGATRSGRTKSVPQGQAPPQISWKTPDESGGEVQVSEFTEAQLHVAVKVNDASQNICALFVSVSDKDGREVDRQMLPVHYDKNGVQSILVKLAKIKTTTTVRAYKKTGDMKSCPTEIDLDKLTAVDGTLTLTTTCASDSECGSAPQVTANAAKEDAASPLSTRNTRVVVGIEQTGASSSASAQNPFIDFFFNAHPRSRVSVWGDVRLTSSPQQVTNFVSSVANVSGAATAAKINDLVSSFDFKFGPECDLSGRQLRANDTRVSMILGFGSSSALTAPSQSGQIFKIPDAASPQYKRFIEEYPGAAESNIKNIAFVPQDHDRFMRQYFAGLRVKSYHGEHFPSMFDMTIGQNASVTGGQLRHLVLGIDGSYQLPLKSFIYIFGSANLKLGGQKVNSTPFILDPTDPTAIKLSDPSVLITSRQLSRDIYRIGFAVDLSQLFKSSNTTDKKQD